MSDYRYRDRQKYRRSYLYQHYFNSFALDNGPADLLSAELLKLKEMGSLPLKLIMAHGDCDAKAVVTKDDVSKEILLKNKHRSMWNR